MSAAPGENLWWTDVLENGPGSPYAAYFDIDWDPVKEELQNRLLLPSWASSTARSSNRARCAWSIATGPSACGSTSRCCPSIPRPIRRSSSATSSGSRKPCRPTRGLVGIGEHPHGAGPSARSKPAGRRGGARTAAGEGGDQEAAGPAHPAMPGRRRVHRRQPSGDQRHGRQPAQLRRPRQAARRPGLSALALEGGRRRDQLSPLLRHQRTGGRLHGRRRRSSTRATAWCSSCCCAATSTGCGSITSTGCTIRPSTCGSCNGIRSDAGQKALAELAATRKVGQGCQRRRPAQETPVAVRHSQARRPTLRIGARHRTTLPNATFPPGPTSNRTSVERSSTATASRDCRFTWSWKRSSAPEEPLPAAVARGRHDRLRLPATRSTGCSSIRPDWQALTKTFDRFIDHAARFPRGGPRVEAADLPHGHVERPAVAGPPAESHFGAAPALARLHAQHAAARLAGDHGLLSRLSHVHSPQEISERDRQFVCRAVGAGQAPQPGHRRGRAFDFIRDVLLFEQPSPLDRGRAAASASCSSAASSRSPAP